MTQVEPHRAGGTCYRHNGREALLSCGRCEKGLCADCAIHSPVGMRCPDCAGRKTGLAAGISRVSTPSGSPILTFFLVAGIAAIFLVELAVNASAVPGVGPGTIRDDGALFGPLVAQGEWWRLVSSAFLHAGLIHVGFNALLLWILGSALESHAGTLRMGLVYVGAVFWGSAGALLLDPNAVTVGASGGVFGLLASAFILEKVRGVQLFQPGFVGPLLVLNLVISFVPGISLGGHLGGLVGGALVTGVFILLGARSMSGLRFQAVPVGAATAVALAGAVVAILLV